MSLLYDGGIMECSGLILCEETTTENEHGALSIKNIVDQLFIQLTAEEQKEGKNILRFTKLPLEIITIWRRHPEKAKQAEKFEYQLEFISPTGENLIENTKGSVAVGENQFSFYSTLRFNDGLPCNTEGVYILRVLVQETTVHEIAFPVFMSTASA